jgi:hypothetical protein
LLVLVLLSQAGQADATSAEAMPLSHPAYSTDGWRYLTRLEATGLALLPSGGVGAVEGYAQLTPMLVVDGGEALGLNLGAPVRLRLAGGEVGSGLVRREDWDDLSDWEVFGWGRLDVDGRLAAQLANRDLEVALSGLALGLGQPGARHLYSGQVRWRFGHKLYGLAEGGTVLFPKPDGTLRPGAFASLGLGVDNAR